MKSSKIGTRGMIVSFEDPYYTNVYVLFGNEHVFVLDTFLGNDSMKSVHNMIDDQGCAHLPIVIFNTHADYDHYWGNGAFKDASILGHELCRERILSEGKSSLTEYAKHKRGEVILLPPHQTFHYNFRFEDEGLLFFHSPGHTLDSSTLYDEIDNVLFVGDNVESPIPYLNHPNFEQYIQTLQSYLDFDWSLLISGHDPPMKGSGLILRNIDYLSRFSEWNIDFAAMSEAEIIRHVKHNLPRLDSQLRKSKHQMEFIRHLEEANSYMAMK